jgi:hypothetical protein
MVEPNRLTTVVVVGCIREALYRSQAFLKQLQRVAVELKIVHYLLY